MKYTRIHRLLRLITLVQGSRDLNARRLAELCQTSERNIYRDVQMLQGAGVPISFDDERSGYSIQRNFFLRPVELTLEEALAMLTLAEQVGVRRQIAHTADAGRAAEKLRAVLPGAIAEMAGELIPRTQIELAKRANDQAADVYATVRQAISTRRALKCEYESLNGGSELDARPFRFDPYALYFGQRAWYAIGLHHAHKQVRTLKLCRFTRCTLTDKPYPIPDDFSLNGYFGQAWRMMPSGTTYDIQLHFDATMAEGVADTHWHDSQDVQWREDGTIDVHFRVDGLEEIIWWILSYGPHCRVIKPAKLAGRVKALHKAAAGQYAASGKRVVV